jgi:hypothetical protein
MDYYLKYSKGEDAVYRKLHAESDFHKCWSCSLGYPTLFIKKEDGTFQYYCHLDTSIDYIDQFPINENVVLAFMKKANENPWINGRVSIEDGDPLSAMEYALNRNKFTFAHRFKVLKEFFEHGNWAQNEAIVYRDLCFVQQINGGDEWLVMKWFKDHAISFESMSFRFALKRGDFEDIINDLCNATEEQCKNLEWRSRKC